MYNSTDTFCVDIYNYGLNCPADHNQNTLCHLVNLFQASITASDTLPIVWPLWACKRLCGTTYCTPLKQCVPIRNVNSHWYSKQFSVFFFLQSKSGGFNHNSQIIIFIIIIGRTLIFISCIETFNMFEVVFTKYLFTLVTLVLIPDP